LQQANNPMCNGTGGVLTISGNEILFVCVWKWIFQSEDKM
jgi:hypothetical protein